jgi:hypothetical protein
MAVYGGYLMEVTYNHPTVGQGSFYLMTEEDSTLDIGGLRKAEEVKIDGSGQAVYEMLQKPWTVDGTMSNDFSGDGAMEKAQKLAEATSEADFTFTHVNGSVYAGKGSVVGDFPASAKGTVPLKFSGSGKLTKLV